MPVVSWRPSGVALGASASVSFSSAAGLPCFAARRSAASFCARFLAADFLPAFSREVVCCVAGAGVAAGAAAAGAGAAGCSCAGAGAGAGVEAVGAGAGCVGVVAGSAAGWVVVVGGAGSAAGARSGGGRRHLLHGDDRLADPGDLDAVHARARGEVDRHRPLLAALQRDEEDARIGGRGEDGGSEAGGQEPGGGQSDEELALVHVDQAPHSSPCRSGDASNDVSG